MKLLPPTAVLDVPVQTPDSAVDAPINVFWFPEEVSAPARYPIKVLELPVESSPALYPSAVTCVAVVVVFNAP